MPFFDYRCSNPECNKEEEFQIARSELDAKEIICSSCQSPMKRLLTNTDFKIAGAPPKNWQPRSANNPKSEVRNVHEIRRVEENK